MIQLPPELFYTLLTIFVGQLGAIVGLILNARKVRPEIQKLTAESEKVEAETGLTVSQIIKNNLEAIKALQTENETWRASYKDLQTLYDDKVEKYKQLFVQKETAALENLRLQDQIQVLTERVGGLEHDLRRSQDQGLEYFKALESARNANLEKEKKIQGLEAVVSMQQKTINRLEDQVKRLASGLEKVEKDTGRLTSTTPAFEDRAKK